MRTLRKALDSAWGLARFCGSVPLLYPWARARRGEEEPWVIGGHRGRIRVDNAGALHDYILEHGAHRAIWIADTPELLAELAERGVPALRRNSLAARWAILKAPVLVYSHGEDDLDLFLILLRRWLGLRVFVNHSMKYMKTGQLHRPDVQRMTGLRRKLEQWLIQDFDAVLASSAREKRNFEQCYPGPRSRFVEGGGAHIDAYMRGRGRPTRREIFYFPTFRQDPEGQRLLEQSLRQLIADGALRRWLVEQDYDLLIGAHINSAVPDVTLPPRMRWVKPAAVRRHLFDCALFVSDYSGLIFDYLALEKPIALFPFDLENYLQTRWLFSDYEEIAYGPVARSADELVALITSGRWSDPEPYATVRQQMMEEIFPRLEPDYAKTSYETILRLLEDAGGSPARGR